MKALNLSLVLFFMMILACSQEPVLKSTYDAVLYTDGGENHFPIYLSKNGDEYSAKVINGLDTVKFTSVEVSGSSIRLSFSHYDSHIEAQILPDQSWKGTWKKRLSGGVYEPMEFSAKPVEKFSRYPNHDPENHLFDGEWQVVFTDEDGVSYPATGIFSTDEKAFFGTFLTETGDYRFLEGAVSDSSFIISDFDGGHAFRFNAKLNSDGTLSGDFWSRKSYHESFVAKRGESQLKDAFALAELSSPNVKLDFSFPEVNGKIVSISDERFKNKPILLYLFGSWCPNCADEARMMKELYETKFKNTDIQIVGLAFEYTGDFKEDAEMVEKYKERFSIPWTLLVAGISDKQAASDVLPFVKKVSAFPSSFFADRNHTIKAAHVGFKGPGTGSYYIQEKNSFINHLNSILN